MRRALLVSGLLAACSAAPRERALPPAGSPGDDGTGQLARASAQLVLGDGAERPALRRGDGEEGEEGGSGYGGAGYGGTGYGGIGFVPAAPVRRLEYTGTDVTNGGAIEGVVRWPHPPAPDPRCADRPSLRRGASGEIEGAVVYLVHIARGRPFAGSSAGRTLGVGGLVERRGCALWPPVQVLAPAPGAIVVSNADGGAVILVGRGDVGFRAALDVGDRRTVPGGAGATEVADDGGGLAPAWVLGLGHPYFAITDPGGRFRIDAIPPGSYELAVWHPPVARDAAPIEVRRPASVSAGGRARVTVELPRR